MWIELELMRNQGLVFFLQEFEKVKPCQSIICGF